MQRVVRSTLLGLLTVAGLTACGDKITVPGATTTPASNVVREVTVSPSSVTIPIGGTGVTLAASVNADAGVTDRTVTWTSSSAAVATVDANGLVRGVAAGTATITAASKADPNVKGAAVVTVQGAAGPGAAPTVTISSINQNPTGQPANVNNAGGQLDVVLNLETNGQTLRSVSATMACPGGTTKTITQTIAGASAVDAEAAAATVVLPFNTAEFNANGVPTLRNGACTITATAVTGATGSTVTQTAQATTFITLNNADGVIITETFSAITNAEGQATLTQAVDRGGLPWRGGNVTVKAQPVLYSGRSLACTQSATTGCGITINLPGANNVNNTNLVPGTDGSVSIVYSGTSTSGAVDRVTGLTLVGAGFEANGITPLGVTPQVVGLDVNGNDLNLGVLNFTQPSLNLPNPTFRLDNGQPQPPTVFEIEPRRAGWANAAYVFTGLGANNTVTTPNGAARYESCGDGTSGTAGIVNATSGTAGYACFGQVGVSAGPIDSDVGFNGLTTFSYYAIPTASYSPASGTLGTSTSATSCSITGFTKIDNAGQLAATLGNTAYVVRVFEKDRLNNARCTDLGATLNAPGTTNINTGTFARGTFGVDIVPPTANFDETNQATVIGAQANDFYDVTGTTKAGQPGTPLANFVIRLGLSDDASGFSGTPVAARVTRLAWNPTTNVASNSAGNFNNAFACPSGLVNNACTTRADASGRPAQFRADLGVATPDGTPRVAGCAGCGYWTYSLAPRDLARNASATIGGSVTPTIAGAFDATPASSTATSGASGYRQLVIDYVRPISGGIQVPASITGGSTASFGTSAADNLDLISSDYTLTYAANPAGNPAPGANLPIRANNPTPLGVAFDNVLTTDASYTINVSNFIRSIATTSAGGAPPNSTGTGAPVSIAARAYDAAGNASLVNNVGGNGFANISPANVPQTSGTNFSTAPAGANPGATMLTFTVTNAAANVSNCPAAGCGGGSVAPANATNIVLTAQATGNEGPTFQFLNPFTQVQFYYFDPTVNEYILIGSAVAPVVTDNSAVTVRTFTWTLSPAFDPPALTLGSGSALRVIAVGVNAAGDALVTPVNSNITLTNP